MSSTGPKPPSDPQPERTAWHSHVRDRTDPEGSPIRNSWTVAGNRDFGTLRSRRDRHRPGDLRPGSRKNGVVGGNRACRLNHRECLEVLLFLHQAARFGWGHLRGPPHVSRPFDLPSDDAQQGQRDDDAGRDQELCRSFLCARLRPPAPPCASAVPAPAPSRFRQRKSCVVPDP